GVAPVRRAEIVEATIRCLARDGYAGLTMKRVAAEARLSQGILHYYFRDKRAILAAAAARVTDDLDRRVAAEARGARGARGRLRALVRACLDVATRDRAFWTVFIEFWGETLHDPELAALNARSYARARRLIGRVVTAGIDEGVFRRVSVGEAAMVMLALLDGLSLQLTFESALVPVGRMERIAETALMAYLERRPTAGLRGGTR
ncbi:MAG TPA: TetR/AcrR family transcriptional regulator, partial [Candidatus Limnocylindrales bacterium]|nr:TetR/AcrR family transcriptional regulator [Candidatus Limnocylindrales bacterium]